MPSQILQDRFQRIKKECFWEYSFVQEDLANIVAGSDFAQKKFLFEKILLNSSRFLGDLRIFKTEDLHQLIDEYKVPQFNYDFAFRRKNMVEVYFFNRPLLIEELKWNR
ncbi:MAG: hypothetical protein H3C43_00885 [Leptonema sp. (in: Bacteria)]|nr:hypothetical protein [Leptonema sp. (in: bacteria)]